MVEPLTGFAGLPSELFSLILDEIEPNDLQHTTYSLLRAIPSAPISRHHLFRHVRLSRSNQPWLLHQRLKSHQGPEFLGLADPLWIKSFRWLGWVVDADVLINLLEVIPNLQDLHVNVGTTFSPEHLVDLLQRPRTTLQRLSFRFRPYVQRATYYQFHAGTYFDGFLNTLSSWPETPSLTTLSIIQDPLPVFDLAEDAPSHALRPSMSFAQPMVFFSLEPITKLAKSPISGHVKHLRFRVPSRTIWNRICEPNAFPRLEVLDLSTTPVHPEQAVAAILNAFPRLRHLIVDASGLGGLGAEDNDWRAVGRTLAMAGIKKARDTERELKHLKTPELHRLLGIPALENGTANTPSRDGSGRNASQPALNANPVGSHSQPDPTAGALQLARFRVLPPEPCLLTLSAARAPHRTEDGILPDYSLFHSDFSAGWADGMARLREHRDRATAFTRSASVRLLQFDVNGQNPPNTLPVVADSINVADRGVDLAMDHPHQVPLLCFGCEKDYSQPGFNPALIPVPHVPNCGHVLGREQWMPAMELPIEVVDDLK